MAWGEARRGSISAAICDRGATKPQAIFGATLRAAGLFASCVVARCSPTADGYARRSRLAEGENPWRRNTSQLRDTTLAPPTRSALGFKLARPSLGFFKPRLEMKSHAQQESLKVRIQGETTPVVFLVQVTIACYGRAPIGDA